MTGNGRARGMGLIGRVALASLLWAIPIGILLGLAWLLDLGGS